MKTQWLLEHDIFPADTEPLVKALKRQNVPYKFASQENYFDRDYFFWYGLDDCVVFVGSLQMAKYIRRHATWIPGVYCDFPKYRCVAYYSALGEHLHNSDYTILPFAELLRNQDQLYEHFGIDRTIFVRPDRGDKIFTGKIVYKEDFIKDVDMFGMGGPEPDDLVVISTPKVIDAEWRFVVVDKKVITGSQYKKDGVLWESRKNIPQGALELAGEVASKYEPDRAWVVDICYHEFSDTYRLMEIGGLSCAGLYDCDRDKVVEAVNIAAIDEFKEVTCPTE
jgi:hypothetical protein